MAIRDLTEFVFPETVKLAGLEKTMAALKCLYPVALRVARETGLPFGEVVAICKYWLCWDCDVPKLPYADVYQHVYHLCTSYARKYQDVRYRMLVDQVFELFAKVAKDGEFERVGYGAWRVGRCTEGKHGIVILDEFGCCKCYSKWVRVSIGHVGRGESDVHIDPFWDEDTVRDMCVHSLLYAELTCDCGVVETRSNEEGSNGYDG